MQGAMDRVSQACDNYDFTVSTKSFGCISTSAWKPSITVNEHRLQVVDKFIYLGGALTRAVK